MKQENKIVTSERRRNPSPILFITGFVQVFFVAVNTHFLANGFFVGVFVTSFMISIIWSHNVKKVAFGDILDRLTYSSGAAFGALAGLGSSFTILNWAQ